MGIPAILQAQEEDLGPVWDMHTTTEHTIIGSVVPILLPFLGIQEEQMPIGCLPVRAFIRIDFSAGTDSCNFL